MNIQEIQTAIRTLPTDEVSALHAWLAEYYHGEVWDRQMEENQARLGPEEWERRLTHPPERPPMPDPMRDETFVRYLVRLTEVLLLLENDQISSGKARRILRHEGFPGEVWQKILAPPQL